MMTSQTGISKVIETVHGAMKCARSQLKSAAVQRNFSDLRPIMHN